MLNRLFYAVLFAALMVTAVKGLAQEEDQWPQFNEHGCEVYAMFINSVAYYRDNKVPRDAIKQMVIEQRVRIELPHMREWMLSEVDRVYALHMVDRLVLTQNARNTCFKHGGSIKDFYIEGI